MVDERDEQGLHALAEEIVTPRTEGRRTEALATLWRRCREQPSLPIPSELEAFLASHYARDVDAAAWIGLIDLARHPERAPEDVPVGVWARLFRALRGAEDEAVQAAARDAFRGQSPLALHTRLLEAFAEDLGAPDELYIHDVLGAVDYATLTDDLDSFVDSPS